MSTTPAAQCGEQKAKTLCTGGMDPSALMQAMGSDGGFDPIPPDQHRWQMTASNDPLIRLWSWMCAHTIRMGHP